MVENKSYLLTRVTEIKNARDENNHTAANRLFDELLSLASDEQIALEYEKSNDLEYIESAIALAIASTNA